MSKIQICGKSPLRGGIKVQGSKNAVLPMMAASVLHKGITVIKNVPRIQDVACMMGILEYIGCSCRLDGGTLTIDASGPLTGIVPEEYVKKMRSSIILLGALLGRVKCAVTEYPGGCSIGKRPIDFHLMALRELGAVIKEEGQLIDARTAGMTGGTVRFSFPSVGATENALLGAVCAEGTTIICGAAKEPEISSFCRFLNNMGACISGIGTDCLTICGTDTLHDSCYTAPGDRIVAGTYLMAAMSSGGEVAVTGIYPEELLAVRTLLERAGGQINSGNDYLSVKMAGRAKAVSAVTGPYPAFPTDLQSPFLALMAAADGDCMVEENVFEGRYETVRELWKMGADILVDGRRALVHGKNGLNGAAVRATDLRGGAALVTAGLGAKGMTEIIDCCHIERGYEDICRDLSAVGAAIRWAAD